MANSPSKVMDALFTGVEVQGNLEDSLLSLVLAALATRNASEVEFNCVDEVNRQVQVMVGTSLAAQFVSKKLNSLRDRMARGE